MIEGNVQVPTLKEILAREPTSKQALDDLRLRLDKHVRMNWLKKHACPLPNLKNLTECQEAEISDCFQLIDRDGSGVIDVAEITEAFTALGIGINKEDVKKLIKELQPHNKGTIDYEAFESLMSYAMSEDVKGLAKTSHGKVNFTDAVRAFRRKKMLESLAQGGEARQKVVDLFRRTQKLIRTELVDLTAKMHESEKEDRKRAQREALARKKVMKPSPGESTQSNRHISQIRGKLQSMVATELSESQQPLNLALEPVKPYQQEQPHTQLLTPGTDASQIAAQAARSTYNSSQQKVSTVSQATRSFAAAASFRAHHDTSALLHGDPQDSQINVVDGGSPRSGAQQDKGSDMLYKESSCRFDMHGRDLPHVHALNPVAAYESGHVASPLGIKIREARRDMAQQAQHDEDSEDEYYAQMASPDAAAQLASNTASNAVVHSPSSPDTHAHALGIVSLAAVGPIGQHTISKSLTRTTAAAGALASLPSQADRASCRTAHGTASGRHSMRSISIAAPDAATTRHTSPSTTICKSCHGNFSSAASCADSSMDDGTVTSDPPEKITVADKAERNLLRYLQQVAMKAQAQEMKILQKQRKFNIRPGPKANGPDLSGIYKIETSLTDAVGSNKHSERQRSPGDKSSRSQNGNASPQSCVKPNQNHNEKQSRPAAIGAARPTTVHGNAVVSTPPPAACQVELYGQRPQTTTAAFGSTAETQQMRNDDAACRKSRRNLIVDVASPNALSPCASPGYMAPIGSRNNINNNNDHLQAHGSPTSPHWGGDYHSHCPASPPIQDPRKHQDKITTQVWATSLRADMHADNNGLFPVTPPATALFIRPGSPMKTLHPWQHDNNTLMDALPEFATYLSARVMDTLLSSPKHRLPDPQLMSSKSAARIVPDVDTTAVEPLPNLHARCPSPAHNRTQQKPLDTLSADASCYTPDHIAEIEAKVHHVQHDSCCKMQDGDEPQADSSQNEFQQPQEAALMVSALASMSYDHHVRHEFAQPDPEHSVSPKQQRHIVDVLRSITPTLPSASPKAILVPIRPEPVVGQEVVSVWATLQGGMNWSTHGLHAGAARPGTGAALQPNGTTRPYTSPVTAPGAKLLSPTRSLSPPQSDPRQHGGRVSPTRWATSLRATMHAYRTPPRTAGTLSASPLRNSTPPVKLISGIVQSAPTASWNVVQQGTSLNQAARRQTNGPSKPATPSVFQLDDYTIQMANALEEVKVQILARHIKKSRSSRRRLPQPKTG